MSATVIDKMLRKLWDVSYSMKDAVSGKSLPRDSGKIRRIIPQGGDIKIFATSA